MIVEQPTLPALSLPKQQTQAHSFPRRQPEKTEREDNKLKMSDRAAHQWYRFVLSFPPHLVRDYARKFGLNARQQVLDPFCGTGTTVVECKKLGIRAVGLESNPIACFASRTKLQWNIDPQELLQHALMVADAANYRLERDGYFDDSTPRLLERPIGKKGKPIQPNANLAMTKVPDATPGIVTKYAFNDEQALLARLRYNRLVDIFTGVTCYSLQNHLRTTVPEMGQVETDELYVGVDKKGSHYVFPIQAKGGTDKLNVVQIEQDFAVCAHKFPGLICRPIGAQFMEGGVIALFEFEQSNGSVSISSEKHYKLVPPEEVTDADLKNYQQRTAD